MEKYDFIVAQGGVMCYNSMASRISSFKSGGKIDTLIQPITYNGLVDALQNLDEEYFVLGGCTNTLISDLGVRGTVLSTRKVTECNFEDNFVTVSCGEKIANIANQTKKYGLSGIEELCGIPGTVGGALYMNAGAYGKNIGEVVEYAEVFNNGKLEIWDNQTLNFGYRDSILNKTNAIVTRVRLKLTNSSKNAVATRIKEVSQKRLKMQPIEPSLGSVFKKVGTSGAGEYIDKAGLKGYTIGGAQISTKHANFIINIGNATSDDYIKLVEIAKTKVAEQFGVILTREVKYFGEGLE